MYLFAISGATSATYTATRECKVALACAGSGTTGMTVAVNGVNVFYAANSAGSANLSHMAYLWLSSGDAITVATIAGSSCVATALLE